MLCLIDKSSFATERKRKERKKKDTRLHSAAVRYARRKKTCHSVFAVFLCVFDLVYRRGVFGELDIQSADASVESIR